MRPLAGPAMLLVMFGGFALYRVLGADDHPSRDFLALDFAGADAGHTGSCYSLDTVLFADRLHSKATRTWESARAGQWVLTIEEVVQDYNGPARRFQKMTFEEVDGLVRLTSVDASKGLPLDLRTTIDQLVDEPNEMKSTPVERCAKAGGKGYRYKRN
jgi:hypothetical protein